MCMLRNFDEVNVRDRSWYDEETGSQSNPVSQCGHCMSIVSVLSLLVLLLCVRETIVLI